MSSYNRVIVMGNLTRDPDLRKVSGGNAVTNLSLAVNESYRNAAGEVVEKACFVEVSVWGATAENCAKYLKKGRPVLVDGKLEFGEWEAANGEHRSKLRVRAQSVKFLSAGGGNGGDGNPGNGGGAGRKPAGKPGAGKGREAVADSDGEPDPF